MVLNEEKIADCKDLLSQKLFSFDVCINSDINIDKKAEFFINFLFDNANKIFGKISLLDRKKPVNQNGSIKLSRS